MQVAKHKVVTIDYILKDAHGEVLEESGNGQFAYIHGADNIIPGLENALTEKSPGDEVSVSIPPEEAYGQRDDALRQSVPLTMFPTPDDVTVGQQFHAQSPDGQPMVITVVDVDENNATIDANHPLAGQTITFDVKVVDVRDASSEEIEHGHVHGPEGHEH